MANRYNFGIKGYTRYSSRSQGVRFMTAYCKNDSDALALGTALEQYLPNYSKVSVAKVLHEAGDVQFPSGATFTDVDLVSFTMSTGGSTPQRGNFKVPVAYSTPGQLQLANVINAVKQYTCTPDGASFAACVSIGNKFYNVVQGSGLDFGGNNPQPEPQP